jgi:hypothetical protein
VDLGGDQFSWRKRTRVFCLQQKDLLGLFDLGSGYWRSMPLYQKSRRVSGSGRSSMSAGGQILAILRESGRAKERANSPQKMRLNGPPTNEARSWEDGCFESYQ